MGKNTTSGRQAYNETRRNGGSKEKAKQASKTADEAHHARNMAKSFRSFVDDIPTYEDDISTFYHPINNGSWHTAGDL